MSHPKRLTAQQMIAALTQENEALRHMAQEYQAFMNYVVVHRPTDPVANVFRIEEDELRKMKPRTVKTEIVVRDGKRGMEFSLCEDDPTGQDQPTPKTKIILPPRYRS